MSYTIVWESDGTVFDSWGDQLDSKTASDLNLGVVYAQRHISWSDFLNQAGLAIGIATASPIFKELVGALIIVSMNAPKSLKITNDMSDAIRSSIKITKEFDYYIDIDELNDFGNLEEVEKVTQWFSENEIGILDEKQNRLNLNSHTVNSMRIF